MLETINQFISQGIAVIPVGFKDKRPDFKLIQSWEQFKTILPDYQTLKDWFATGLHNYGVIAGWRNLTIIDFDDLSTYRAWLIWCRQQGGMALDVSWHAYRVSTGRGVHVYIRLPEKIKNKKLMKVDVKSDGYVLGPGSTHPNGNMYRAQGEMRFPLIRVLSDILPASLLLSNQAAGNTPAPKFAVAVPSDPWQAANAPAKPTSQGMIEKIKQHYKIEELLPDRQPSSTDGRWYLARCPLHDDHNPSFWVDTQNQIGGCFSGCTEKPVDVINLFARMNGLDNHLAIVTLGEMV